MNKTIPTYINALSDNYDILEEIFIYKYKEFITLYQLISAYSNYTNNLNYKITDKDTLKIDLLVDNDVCDDIVSNIRSDIDKYDTEEIIVRKMNDIIHIKIKKKSKDVS
jgi:hypothetical protein